MMLIYALTMAAIVASCSSIHWSLISISKRTCLWSGGINATNS
ncbi:MAG: hypothetical protein QW534_02390 [Candidatus Methanomethylicia archaeon]